MTASSSRDDSGTSSGSSAATISRSVPSPPPARVESLRPNILAAGRLLLASNTGEMVAVNARTGEVERSVNLGESVTVGPIALGETVYFVTDEARLIAVR